MDFLPSLNLCIRSFPLSLSTSLSSNWTALPSVILSFSSMSVENVLFLVSKFGINSQQLHIKLMDCEVYWFRIWTYFSNSFPTMGLGFIYAGLEVEIQNTFQVFSYGFWSNWGFWLQILKLQRQPLLLNSRRQWRRCLITCLRRDQEKFHGIFRFTHFHFVKVE